MNAETKIYSDFIQRNHIRVGSITFMYHNEEYAIERTNQGWFVNFQNGPYLTKKSAIYWTIKIYQDRTEQYNDPKYDN